MWRKVLSQAAKDAALRHSPRRADIAAWLMNEDFIRVCELARVKPDPMRLALKQLLLADPDDRKLRSDLICNALASVPKPAPIGETSDAREAA